MYSTHQKCQEEQKTQRKQDNVETTWLHQCVTCLFQPTATPTTNCTRSASWSISHVWKIATKNVEKRPKQQKHWLTQFLQYLSHPKCRELAERLDKALRFQASAPAVAAAVTACGTLDTSLDWFQGARMQAPKKPQKGSNWCQTCKTWKTSKTGQIGPKWWKDVSSRCRALLAVDANASAGQEHAYLWGSVWKLLLADSGAISLQTLCWRLRRLRRHVRWATCMLPKNGKNAKNVSINAEMDEIDKILDGMQNIDNFDDTDAKKMQN